MLRQVDLTFGLNTFLVCFCLKVSILFSPNLVRVDEVNTHSPVQLLTSPAGTFYDRYVYLIFGKEEGRALS